MKLTEPIRNIGWFNAGLAVALLLLVALSGCASTTPPAPVVQYVPVKAHPIPLPGRPHLAVQDLSSTEDAPTVMKAYTASLVQCTGYASELETLIVKANAQ
ncbi:hypothetical protein BLA23254_03313 [Burkholderia lata]|uniref:Lipoprotein n=1 Tax=Burkholderia lata (strain ATCC 17760 / DSM 23089 / LMG 22485 / NCIMB 9086 / R18194 / 383) TaxID=482957 RepID=A0A6P2LUU1_BURL3|nr:hypothetical protein [Burkholderia lata]VWB70946.1 hypothetical protein BLA23254_03313 [Burkholderia lata]